MCLNSDTFSLTHFGVIVTARSRHLDHRDPFGALLYPLGDMAKKKWESNDQFPSGNADVRHELKPHSTAKAEKIRMDAYWRDHADTLEEPFRSQLLTALDLFRERRAAGNGT